MVVLSSDTLQRQCHIKATHLLIHYHILDIHVSINIHSNLETRAELASQDVRDKTPDGCTGSGWAILIVQLAYSSLSTPYL